MSKHEADPERLSAMGATALERRLLEAASREQPSAELSERMAKGLGIALVPGLAATAAPKASTATGTAASAVAQGSSSLVPWVSGALVAVGVVVGAYITTLHGSKSPAARTPLSAPSAPPSVAEPVASLARPAPVAPVADEPLTSQESAPKAAQIPPSARGSHSTPAGELAAQIALVDAARHALASGSPQRALSIAREYQAQYPRGTFRPEVAAVKIEALMKLGRTSEARALAERFVVSYGAGPLATRVARLVQIAEP